MLVGRTGVYMYQPSFHDGSAGLRCTILWDAAIVPQLVTRPLTPSCCLALFSISAGPGTVDYLSDAIGVTKRCEFLG